jgi:uncharacterized protein YjiS (DUF1127 family)
MSSFDAAALPEIAPARVLAAPAATDRLLPFRLARSAMSATLQQLLLWQERATQRHHLMTTEDHRLRDMGLTRAAVAREIRKPFWRP